MTFHKLVNKIYKEYLNKKIISSYATDEDIQKCIDAVKRGKLKLRFKAIFIDEVQIFNPLYLELCYYLLDKEDSDHVFLMAGDLNQAVRNLSRKGDAPWKQIKDVSLDFTGRVRYIEKNYRNSKEIAEYISNMLRHQPEKAELDMDSHGWVSVEQLIDGVNRHSSYKLDRELLDHIVAEDNKGRYRYDEKHEKIKCCQGHSVPWVEPELEYREPPEFLYHGTTTKALEAIEESGAIKKMARHVLDVIDTGT